jgi:hypothetical protein
LAFWLFGFLAFWLFGFSAFRSCRFVGIFNKLFLSENERVCGKSSRSVFFPRNFRNF